MESEKSLRAALGAAVAGGASELSIADRLCHACVELLSVDGAALSLIHEGAMRGTFGASNDLSRRMDELQFTFGEGPCLDSVRDGCPVLIPDLRGLAERRWPAFAEAVLGSGVRAVYALPISVASSPVGALDLFRSTPGLLSDVGLTTGLLAAELAALPLLDLLGPGADWEGAGDEEDGWSQLASLDRVEVYQATGMVMGQLEVGSAEALVRLRAHAYASGLTASEVAWQIIDRRLVLDRDDVWGGPGGTGDPS